MGHYCGFGGKKGTNSKRVDKPLHEASFDERFTPNWDIVAGMGQQHERVIARYKRGANSHPHAVRPGQGK